MKSKKEFVLKSNKGVIFIEASYGNYKIYPLTENFYKIYWMKTNHIFEYIDGSQELVPYFDIELENIENFHKLGNSLY